MPAGCATITPPGWAGAWQTRPSGRMPTARACSGRRTDPGAVFPRWHPAHGSGLTRLSLKDATPVGRTRSPCYRHHAKDQRSDHDQCIVRQALDRTGLQARRPRASRTASTARRRHRVEVRLPATQTRCLSGHSRQPGRSTPGRSPPLCPKVAAVRLSLRGVARPGGVRRTTGRRLLRCCGLLVFAAGLAHDPIAYPDPQLNPHPARAVPRLGWRSLPASGLSPGPTDRPRGVPRRSPLAVGRRLLCRLRLAHRPVRTRCGRAVGAWRRNFRAAMGNADRLLCVYARRDPGLSRRPLPTA